MSLEKYLYVFYSIDGEIINFKTINDYNIWLKKNYGKVCGILKGSAILYYWAINKKDCNPCNKIPHWFEELGWDIKEGFNTEEKRITFRLAWL